MSQENVEIVQAAFDAWDRGDTGAILGCATRTSWSSRRQSSPASRLQNGHAGVLEAFALWPGYWDDYWIEIVRARDLGEQVLVTTDQGGRSKETGIEVTAQFTFLFTLREGKITEWRSSCASPRRSKRRSRGRSPAAPQIQRRTRPL